MARDYLALITEQHRDKPKFSALVDLLTSSAAAASSAAIPAAFDLDSAIGAQLDAIGLWVGLSREVLAPIPGTSFSFDTPGLGFDEGTWAAGYAPTEGVVQLDDPTYRAAIRLKILCNHWKGLRSEWDAIPIRLEHSTDDNLIFCADNQDMTITVYICGPSVSMLLRAAIRQGGLVPKPMGVSVAGFVYISTPILSLDSATRSASGLDVGGFVF